MPTARRFRQRLTSNSGAPRSRCLRTVNFAIEARPSCVKWLLCTRPHGTIRPGWSDGRVVEGGGLENRCGVYVTGGSNPSRSANHTTSYRGRCQSGRLGPPAKRLTVMSRSQVRILSSPPYEAARLNAGRFFVCAWRRLARRGDNVAVWLWRSRIRGRDGKRKVEQAALPGDAVDADLTAELLDNALDNRQAQAVPLRPAGVQAGEFDKQQIAHLRVDAVPVVSHPKAHHAALLQLCAQLDARR